MADSSNSKAVWGYCFICGIGTFEVKDWNIDSGEPDEYEADGSYKISNSLIVLIFNDEGSTYSEEYTFDIINNTLIIYDYEEKRT